MAYWVDSYTFQNSIEYEIKWAGNYGAKGEKRAPKKKPSKEQIIKQNQKNKEIYMRRVLKLNFTKEDLWVTLKYAKGTRKPLGQILKDMKNFQTAMRRHRKKAGEPYKWIRRIEIGKRGGIHIHMVINRVRDEPTDQVIRDKWKKYGKVHFESLYEEDDFQALAEYIVKPVPEELEGQLEMFSLAEQKQLAMYSCSRNLERPKPKRKVYSRWTVKRMLEEGPKPTEGYYIDKDSIVTGINLYTGMSYLRYTEIRLKPIRDGTGG